MKDKRLVDLNFCEIVDYDGQPQVENKYSKPINCRGYCVDCEKTGVLKKSGGHLDLMSHGCDSSDYEAILGQMPREGICIDQPILFLLEDPGGYDRNGRPIEFLNYKKQPPVNHYYWTPNIREWPENVTDFIDNWNYYGPYFAYLMRHHQLLNIYITNLVKCKWSKDLGYQGEKSNAKIVLLHCVKRFLTREVQIFSPKIAFCFGGNSERGFRKHIRRTKTDCLVINLMHPAYIKHRSQTS